MSRRSSSSRWRMLAFCLAGGLLLQTSATSCSTIGVEAAASLGSSITTQLIRNSIYQFLGLGGSTSSLSGLSGLGS